MPSDLPIITPPEPPPPPKRSAVERFGGLYYLGVVGLVVLVVMVSWFVVGVWLMRADLAQIYRLHDSKETVDRRVQAAFELSKSQRVTQRQYWDMALRTSSPALARYLLAESLTTEALAADPRGYALAVAKSKGWPPWFRCLIARPLAYASPDRLKYPPELTGELVESLPDPHARLWVALIIVISGSGSATQQAEAQAALEIALESADPTVAELAGLLIAVRDENDQVRRIRRLDRVTRWMRRNYPPAAEIWNGWEVGEAGLQRVTKEPITKIN